MKEPWEVYYESFVHHARDVDFSTIPFSPGSDDSRKAGAAFMTARESLVYHLAEALHWRRAPVRQLADEFFDVTRVWLEAESGESLETLRDRLRHQWTDWCLRNPR